MYIYIPIRLTKTKSKQILLFIFYFKANGKHNAALSTAATNAAAHFKTSSQTLKELSGSDLKQKNTEYNKAVDLLLQETKKMIDAGPCDEIASIIRNALNELKNDSENYQVGYRFLK